MPYTNPEVRREYMRLYMQKYRKRERQAIRQMRMQGFSTKIGGLARSILKTLKSYVFTRKGKKPKTHKKGR